MFDVEHYFNQPVYQLTKYDKKLFLETELLNLTRYHQEKCEKYANILSAFQKQEPTTIEEIIPVAVQLFKEFELKSIPQEKIYKQLMSSGTTGEPSRIFLDTETAKLQTKILIKILQQWLGKKRLPLLLIDAPNIVKPGDSMSARAVGLQGLSFLGYDHTYALDSNMELNLPVIEAFFTKHKNTKILMFGFTFMVWQHFIQALKKLESGKQGKQFQLADAILLHGGGWKKLQNQAVTNDIFKHTIQQTLGNVSVHDYYGMVEQTGTIYIECEKGYLHCPVWSDILIRKASDLSLCKEREQGLIQVNSLLALSYPGHCILTEDIGEIIGEDNCACGKKGKYFKVHGRVPKSEIRGCSDTFS